MSLCPKQTDMRQREKEVILIKSGKWKAEMIKIKKKRKKKGKRVGRKRLE